jgi:hypothetical protein
LFLNTTTTRILFLVNLRNKKLFVIINMSLQQNRRVSFSDMNKSLTITNGNVGIGTTAPAHTLDVNGGMRSINFTTTSALITNVTTGTLNATNVVGNSISAGTLVGTTITGANVSLSGNLIIAGTLTTVNITSTNVLNTNVSAGTIASTNSTITNIVGTNISAGSIRSTGIVHVGLSSSSNTGLGSSSYVASNGFVIGGNSSAYIRENGSGVTQWQGLNNSGQIHLQPYGGVVGIGTASPGYTLDVNGTGRFTGKLTITGSAGATGFDTATNDQYADMRVIRNSTSSIDKDMYIQLGAGATSTLRLYSNNTETMTLNGTNVGIGVASPSSKLHVNGNRINIHNAAGTSGGQNLFGGVENASARAQIVLSSSYSDLVIASSQANDVHGSTLTFASYNPSNSSDYRKWVINQGNWGSRVHMLEFGYNPNNIVNPHSGIDDTYTTMTLDGTNKRLGIGTRSPAYRLDVNGDALARGWLRTTGQTGFFNDTYSKGVYVKDSTWVRTYPDGSAFACGTLNCNDITTNNNAIAMGSGTINFNSNGAGLNWGSNYSQIFDNGDLCIKTDDNMRFFSGNVERMVLNSGGLYISGSTIANLLIPMSGGGIVGGDRLNDTFTHNSISVNHYGLKWNNDSDNTGGAMGYLTGWGGLKFFTYGNLRMYIPGFNVQSAVQIRGNNNVQTDWPGGWDGGLATRDISCTSIYYSGLTQRSDIRKKTNIQTYTRGLNEVIQLRPVTFNWKPEHYYNSDEEQYGFIAQEVEQIIPEIVDEDSQGYKNIKNAFIPILVNSIRELKAELDAMFAELSALKTHVGL